MAVATVFLAAMVAVASGADSSMQAGPHGSDANPGSGRLMRRAAYPHVAAPAHVAPNVASGGVENSLDEAESAEVPSGETSQETETSLEHSLMVPKSVTLEHGTIVQTFFLGHRESKKWCTAGTTLICNLHFEQLVKSNKLQFILSKEGFSWNVRTDAGYYCCDTKGRGIVCRFSSPKKVTGCHFTFGFNTVDDKSVVTTITSNRTNEICNANNDGRIMCDGEENSGQAGETNDGQNFLMDQATPFEYRMADARASFEYRMADARAYIAKTVEVLKQEDAEGKLTTWFGTSDTGTPADTRSEVSEVVSNMHDLLDIYPIFPGHCKRHNALVATGVRTIATKQLIVNVCPLWEKLFPSNQARVIIHEMAHQASPLLNDIKYGEANCENLAKTNPEGALNNADSYSYFCVDMADALPTTTTTTTPTTTTE